MGSAAEELMVCRLCAGAKGIRTLGPPGVAIIEVPLR
jgi:hypothetical protein